MALTSAMPTRLAVKWTRPATLVVVAAAVVLDEESEEEPEDEEEFVSVKSAEETLKQGIVLVKVRAATKT
jgi:hypothetical protein